MRYCGICYAAGTGGDSADLVAFLANHFKSSVNIITQRYHLGNCNRWRDNLLDSDRV